MPGGQCLFGKREQGNRNNKLLLATHKDTLGLGFSRVRVSTKLQIIPGSKLFTCFQHHLHYCPLWCQQDQIICIPYFPHEGIPHIATNTQISQIDQDLIHVDGIMVQMKFQQQIILWIIKRQTPIYTKKQGYFTLVIKSNFTRFVTMC